MLLAAETQAPDETTGKPVDLKDFMFLIEVIAHKFRNKRRFERIQDSEVYSVAATELVRAAATFNSKINKDFSRFAYRAMRNGVIEYLRYCNRKKRVADLVYMSLKEWGHVKEREGQQAAVGNPSQILSDILKDCPEDTEQDRLDKTILLEVYIKGKKVPVIAEQYGISRVTVYNRINRIIKKIRERNTNLIEGFEHE